MINPMFGRQPKPKRFDLPLRYYDPSKDERELRKRRLNFQRNTRVHRKQAGKTIMLAILLAFIVYIISLLGRVTV